MPCYAMAVVAFVDAKKEPQMYCLPKANSANIIANSDGGGDGMECKYVDEV